MRTSWSFSPVLLPPLVLLLMMLVLYTTTNPPRAAEAWTTAVAGVRSRRRSATTTSHRRPPSSPPSFPTLSGEDFPRLSLSSPTNDVEAAAEAEIAAELPPPLPSSSSSVLSFLEEAEWKSVHDLHLQASMTSNDTGDTDEQEKETTTSSSSYQRTAEQIFPTFAPELILKLRQGARLLPVAAADETKEVDPNERYWLDLFQTVTRALTQMTESRLEHARTTLEQFLHAGEIKKLDALIGRAARDGNLDVAFFQVVQLNLQDSANAAAVTAVVPAEEKQETTKNEEEEEGAATTTNTTAATSRSQILQHIYTRCQEEVEKTLNPGTALLNKVLRTDVVAIQTNQLHHYLCPKNSTITAPDGTVLQLTAQPTTPLVSHAVFCTAIATAVQQIRTLEHAGALGNDGGREAGAGEGRPDDDGRSAASSSSSRRVVAATLIEAIRTVASQARNVIGEQYGATSNELRQYEDALEPVFRPTQPGSPYAPPALLADDNDEGAPPTSDAAATSPDDR